MTKNKAIDMRKILIGFTCMVGLMVPTVALADIKVGMAFDQGFGVTGQFYNVNAFVGNDGVSADYIFKAGDFGKDIPLNWYVAGGAYYNWHGDNTGVRVPLGLAFPFAKSWDVYGQLSPVFDVDLDRDKMEFNVDFALGIRYAF